VLRVWPRVLSALAIVVRVVTDLVGWVALAFRSRQSLDAEVLFLRRQLALYVERVWSAKIGLWVLKGFGFTSVA